MLVSRAEDEHYMKGLEWNDHPQTWRDMLRPDVDRIEFDLISGSEIPYRYRICSDCSWLMFSSTEGEVKKRERITLTVNKALLSEKVTGTFRVEGIDIGCAHVTVEAAPLDAPKGLFIESDGYICMEAEHFSEKKDIPGGGFKVLSPYGRSGSAIKAFPVTKDFYRDKKRPSVTYRFLATEDGEYEVTFYLAPTTPVTFKPEQYLGYSVNGSRTRIVSCVRNPEIQFFFSPQWREEARDNVKKVTDRVKLVNGENKLEFFGCSPGIVLERIVLIKKGIEIPESYLGPRESYIRGLEEE
jgi:hypothetical protein